MAPFDYRFLQPAVCLNDLYVTFIWIYAKINFAVEIESENMRAYIIAKLIVEAIDAILKLK